MKNSENHKTECILSREVDRTMYEIDVMISEKATESAEDIIMRMIIDDAMEHAREVTHE